MKRIVWIMLVFLVIGCGEIKNMSLRADLKECEEFAKRESNEKGKQQELINRCMEGQGHLGFEIRAYQGK